MKTYSNNTLRKNLQRVSLRINGLRQDLGYFNKENYLYIKDRIDNMIIVSGENIYPSEIESHIYNYKKLKLVL